MKVIRSSSNPDLLSSETDHLTGNGHLLGLREDSPASTSSSETPPPSGMVITYSEDTTEAAAEAMEEFLQRPAGQPGSFNLIAAMLGGIRAKRRVKKKGRKFSVDDSSSETRVVPQAQRGGGSAPSSPRPQHSEPDLRAKNRGNHVRMFRRGKGSLLGNLRSHDHSGESTEVISESADMPETHPQSESGEGNSDHHQPRLQISSPLARDWSGSELRNEELQSLVQPPPTAWTKTGYLWLRMQQDQRYAWTHIVSTYNVYTCMRLCACMDIV